MLEAPRRRAGRPLGAAPDEAARDVSGAPSGAPSGAAAGEGRLARLVPGAAPVAALDRVVLAPAGRRLIDGLSLAVRAGEVAALMGPNGAGKSLALRLLAGLVAPEAGRVLWGGAPAARPGHRPAARPALVFQRPTLLRRSVEGNLWHALRLAGTPRRERRARLAHLLGLGRLETLAETPARALSGGEQQRLALVRALAFRPALLLLDEPTASLDPEAVARIEALVGRVARGGVAILIVTHDAGQARRLAQRVLFLDRGRLVEDAPAARFFRAPRSAEARAYLDGRLVLRPQEEDG